MTASSISSKAKKIWRGRPFEPSADARQRFEEDRLRMIRAVRFAASLEFTIDAETFAAIQELAPTIAQISWERIGDEITRILTEGGARRGFELLDGCGLLAALMPEIGAMKGTPQSPDYHPEGRRLSAHHAAAATFRSALGNIGVWLLAARRRQAVVCASGGATHYVLWSHRARRRNG